MCGEPPKAVPKRAWTQRLAFVANRIEKECGRGLAVADVGCDHAWLPIGLVDLGIARKAVAIDEKEGPLQAARTHAAEVRPFHPCPLLTITIVMID